MSNFGTNIKMCKAGFQFERAKFGGYSQGGSSNGGYKGTFIVCVSALSLSFISEIKKKIVFDGHAGTHPYAIDSIIGVYAVSRNDFGNSPYLWQIWP